MSSDEFAGSATRPSEGRITPCPPARPSPSYQQPSYGLNPLQEYHSGYSDGDSASPSISTHRRQQSFPNLLPNLSFRNRTPSPVRNSILPEPMPYTGDRRLGARDDSNPKGGFAGWLSGTSAAASALGKPPNQQQPLRTPEGAIPTGDPVRNPTPDTTPTRLRRSGTISSMTDSAAPKSAVSTTASRFMNAISSRFTPTPASPVLDDELCNLDIEQALFPPGTPTDRDPFSPAAYKNLQANAIGLLTKMQGAYRERVITLRDFQAERLAQRDEMEEAETRAHHLKMQLEGMAHKAQEQEKAMRQLMDELAAERRSRAEERMSAGMRSGRHAVMSSEGSMVSEDLGVDEEMRRKRNKWRESGGTVKSDTTAGFDDDTDDEESAESESVFSRCRSPAIPPPVALQHGGSTIGFDGSGHDDAPLGRHHIHHQLRGGSSTPSSTSLISRARNAPVPVPVSGPQPPQMNAFQKIIRGISGEDATGSNGCTNCKGQDASMAWDTVSLLRDENKHLKQRVSALEVAVEGALDLVNGIGL